MLGGGGEHAADQVAVLGSLQVGEPAGDVLLDLRGPQVAFGLVGGGRDPQVGGEAQEVVLAPAEGFEQEAGLAGTGAGVVQVLGVGEADRDGFGPVSATS